MSASERRVRLSATAADVRVCTRCPLHGTRTNAVPGEGAAAGLLLFIREAPGRDEDAAGRPFVGRAGRILDSVLAAAGVPRDSIFITNLVKCRPPGNRKPRRSEIEACRPYLLEEIAAVHPRTIVTLGATALQGLLGSGHELKRSRIRSLRLEDVPVAATYHPAASLYNRKLEATLCRDVERAVARSAPGSRRGAAATERRTSRARAA